MNSVEWTARGGGRLDAEVRGQLALSHTKARRAISTGKVQLNGSRCQAIAEPIRPGDRLSLDWSAPNPARSEPFGVRLIYRDRHLIVLDKPAGLLSVPLPRDDAPTALHAAGRLCRGGGRPKVVHRLDKQTSGLLVFARSTMVARALRRAIDSGGASVKRMYNCVVVGAPDPDRALVTSMLLADAGRGKKGSRKGTLRVRPLNTRDPGPMPGKGKIALTRYRTLLTRDGRSALEVWLATGRTHQIRIHLAELGCPVLGDAVYGQAEGAPRQALHAARLGLTHPVSGEPLSFRTPWPADLAEVTPRGKRW